MGDLQKHLQKLQNIVKNASHMARAAGEVVSESLTSPTVWALRDALGNCTYLKSQVYEPPRIDPSILWARNLRHLTSKFLIRQYRYLSILTVDLRRAEHVVVRNERLLKDNHTG
jgi:hypothetical protein